MKNIAALVQNADIIYFPHRIAGAGVAVRTGDEISGRVAAQRKPAKRKPFAIGWDLIGGEEQALLDQWAKRQLSTENLISRLHLSGTARERENCRALLGETKEWGVRFLALRCPADLLAAARSEATLDALARPEIPRGFHPPPGDFQRFAERFSARRDE